MSDAFDFEKATAFGALDSALIADPYALSAHHARSIGMNVNLLNTRSVTLANHAWKYTSTYTRGNTFIIPAPPFWRVMFDPIPILKPPHAVKGWLYIDFNQEDGTDITEILVMTNANFGPVGTGAGISGQITTAGPSRFTLGPIPFVQGESDFLYTFIRGEGTGDLMATGTYGTPNVITTPVFSDDGWRVYQAGNSWNSQVGQNYTTALFLNGGGGITESRFIPVGAFGANGELQMHQPIADEQDRSNVSTVRLERTTQLQILSLMVRTDEF